MRRFISAVGLCLSLLAILSYVVTRPASAEEKEDVLRALLDLPAPPPPNPLDPPLTQRSAKFFDRSTPPGDDAPIQDLLDYWKYQSEQFSPSRYSPRPSEKTLGRLLAEIEKDPSIAADYKNILRGSDCGAELVKKAYDSLSANDEGTRYQRSMLKTWLKQNSSYFADELTKSAAGVTDTEDYLVNADDLHSLSRIDWERARPIVNNLYADKSQPSSQVLARWVLYRRALEEGSLSDIERYRNELQEMVADKKASIAQRDLALDALILEKEWGGRDDWYFSLFEDETLTELGRFTGLTTMMLHSPDDRYVPKMLEFAKSDNPAVRAAAVRNLTIYLSPERPEVVRALLPWLEDPKWAKDIDNGRQKLVTALSTVKMPESVPGLIATLEESEVREMPEPQAYGNMNVNVAMNSMLSAQRAANSNIVSSAVNSTAEPKLIKTTVYPLRDAAVGALEMQADPRAAVPLRRVFPQVQEYLRSRVVSALLASNGFSVDEQLEALEAHAKVVGAQAENLKALATQAAAAMPDAANMVVRDVEEEIDEEAMMLQLQQYMGAAVSNSMTSYMSMAPQNDMQSLLGVRLASAAEVSDDLARAVVKRIEVLEKSDRLLAEAMRAIAVKWKNQVVNLFLLKELKTGKTSMPAIVKLLTVRSDLREKNSSEIFEIRTGAPIALGISACLLESSPDYSAILSKGGAEAKTALLACARLIRAHLPVPEVAVYFKDKDKGLALAAERYLESEDSVAARNLVLAHRPGEARILGATTAFRGGPLSIGSVFAFTDLFASVNEHFATLPPYGIYYEVSEFDKLEKRLQKEVKEDRELVGIYAYDRNFIRVFKDRAVFSWEEDDSRYRERKLETEEFDNLKNYLAHHKVDELGPFLACSAPCEAKELLMLGKNGGRRVFTRSTRPAFFAGLEAIFRDMKKPPAKLRYWLEKYVPDLEIVFADDKHEINAVWKNGGDLRVLAADKAREKEIEQELAAAAERYEEEEEPDPSEEEKHWRLAEKRKYEHFGWFHLSNGRLGAGAAQPAEMEFLPVADGIEPPRIEAQWKARAGNTEIRTSDDGLYKVSGGKATRVSGSEYSQPVVTANGQWVVVTKWDENDYSLVRINLLTRRQYKVSSENNPVTSAIVYVPSVNRVLVSPHGGGDDDYVHGASPHVYDGSGVYFWLDPQTGSVQPATGELRPLAQQEYRPLQPAVNTAEFWAAIPNHSKNETVFGIYNSKTFTMKPLLTLSKVLFNSQDMWVDVAGAKVYFVYRGHLLSVTFPTTPVKK